MNIHPIRFCLMQLSRFVFAVLLFCLMTACSTESPVVSTHSGLDNIDELAERFRGKRVGIVTNHSAYNSRGQYITDVIARMPEVRIGALFGPEHGIRGSAEAGEKVVSGNDPLSGIPIYSLYGKTRKPTSEMLNEIDILVFDIQAIGARFYTYIYTMALAMEAAAEHQIPFVILDRPNPISGEMLDGNILDTAFASFVGLYPIPTVHGMTIGELGKMFNEEGWLKNGIKADLTVSRLTNWQRAHWFDETGLKFINPSPNIPDLDCASIYPGTCLIEGTNVSEGRGTATPFRLIGAPWISGPELSSFLRQRNLGGLEIRDTVFTPVSIAGASTNPKHKDQRCGGIVIEVIDRDKLRPYTAGLEIVAAIHQLYSDSLQWRESHFDRLCGTDKIRKAIISGQEPDQIAAAWQNELRTFEEMRSRYLIY